MRVKGLDVSMPVVRSVAASNVNIAMLVAAEKLEGNLLALLSPCPPLH